MKNIYKRRQRKSHKKVQTTYCLILADVGQPAITVQASWHSRITASNKHANKTVPKYPVTGEQETFEILLSRVLGGKVGRGVGFRVRLSL
jgi:hypothetical protein